jgi:hypothetical protein
MRPRAMARNNHIRCRICASCVLAFIVRTAKEPTLKTITCFASLTETVGIASELIIFKTA